MIIYICDVYLDTSIILTRAHGDEIFTKRYLSTTLKQSVTGDMPLCILRSRGVAPESARYSVSDHQKLLRRSSVQKLDLLLTC